MAAIEKIQRTGQRLFDTAATIKKFNPNSRDGSDYKRFSKQFEGLVAVAGDDFVAAMHYRGSGIPLAPAYSQASVVSDMPASAPSVTLPQLRQQLLLAALRAALEADDEPMRIIKHCTQMGGVVNQVGASPKKQAWQLLHERYFVSDYTQTGDYAKALFGMQSQWPTTVTPAAFQVFFAAATDKADRSGYYPQDDTPSSATLRASWWPVVTEPIGASPHWYELIRMALLSVNYQHDTCVEIQAYFHAMVQAATYHERT
jgi:hypothetical protein